MDQERTQAQSRPTIVTYGKTRVSVIDGPDRGLVCEMAGRPIRVGTASDNDLVLSDPTVSRRHCAIVPTPEGFRVSDEGSTNGVLVGRVRIFEAVLIGSSELRIGETTVSVVPLPDRVEREQATIDHFGDLLGASPAMRELFADLARIADSDVTVLIEGETGTGKELVAESLHSQSRRADKPLVVFDCSAVSPTLVESELFGHERGAFTGAVAAREGVFEQADGGSIFLDELGELPKDLQPKLLRVLEKREVRRLGSQRAIAVDVRVLAATNRKLSAEVAAGNFRQDLYFRLAGAHVVVPPLRDRKEDLRMLVEHFLSRSVPPRTLSEMAAPVWEMFMAHRWPGNVRELRNAVDRWAVTPERALGALELTVSGEGALKPEIELVPLRIARRDASDDFERRYLRALLARTQGNVTRAAAIAEVSRQMIQKLMRKQGLS
ncbi:MAG TPA: sigma 54-interacting transcriptional regulator [Polyangiaceae bacterium]|nr:sigma 54-interacting transcriptional regulator [Polyangiaceae bacterium]